MLAPCPTRATLTRRPFRLALLAVAGAALVACAPGGAPTASPGERATSLAQTAAAILTATAAFVTPPTPTPRPSATPTSTATPTATPSPRPTLTPPPTASPTITATPCENDSAFVTDVSVPDGTRFEPGTAFVKTWRLRNRGVCTWTTDYTFRHVAGDLLGGAPLHLTEAVAPGAFVDLPVALTAPSASGIYSGTWQLHNPAGEAFGTKPYVEIVVP